MSALPPLLLRGDCLHELNLIPDASIDAVVTDPPYGLVNTNPAHVVEALTRWAQGEREFIPAGRGFMGKAWDAFVPPPAVWDECARILKPGGHLLAFAGSRTFDLMTLSIRFAGFDIRDSIAWLYGSGFPKSMNVAKAIAAMEAGHGSSSGAIRRATMGDAYVPSGRLGNRDGPGRRDTGLNEHKLPLSETAQEWEGWGTALKPAFEPIIVARKPFPGAVAANVLKHGTGALNIDATRIGVSDAAYARNHSGDRGHAGTRGEDRSTDIHAGGGSASSLGRWPANVALNESQAAALDEQSGYMKDGASVNRNRSADEVANKIYGARKKPTQDAGYGGGGGASRFFYVAKAPKSERPVLGGTAHPTVKPLALMRWLLRLVTPPRGVIVDPFAGSGTTLEAAYLEDFDAIGAEMTPEYWPLIEARIARVTS